MTTPRKLRRKVNGDSRSLRRVVGALRMWAVIVKANRSESINWTTIHRTRSGAWKLYKDQWVDEYQSGCEADRRKGLVRLAKVTVAECPNGDMSNAAEKSKV